MVWCLVGPGLALNSGDGVARGVSCLCCLNQQVLCTFSGSTAGWTTGPVMGFLLSGRQQAGRANVSQSAVDGGGLRRWNVPHRSYAGDVPGADRPTSSSYLVVASPCAQGGSDGYSPEPGSEGHRRNEWWWLPPTRRTIPVYPKGCRGRRGSPGFPVGPRGYVWAWRR